MCGQKTNALKAHSNNSNLGWPGELLMLLRFEYGFGSGESMILFYKLSDYQQTCKK